MWRVLLVTDLIGSVYRYPRRLVSKCSHRIYSRTDTPRQRYEKAREWLQRPRFRKRNHIAKVIEYEQAFEIPTQGFCKIDSGTFSEIEEIIDRSRAYSQRIDLSAARATSNKQHLLYPPIPEQEYNLSSPFFRFALNQRLIASITRYLGGVPVLYRLSFMHSRHVPGADVANSQLFHCDWDAVSQIKIFVHISNIDEGSGPLVLVDAEESARLRKKLNYIHRSIKTGGEKYRGPRLTDEEVYANTDRRFVHSIKGPPGTTVMVDTSRCLHFGSRIEGGQPPRIVLLLWYLKPSSFRFPLWSSKSFPYRNMNGGTSELQKLVLGR